MVLRVETPQRWFVLKQSRPQLRTRDAWFSDLERVYRKEEVMRVLEPLLPPLTVPRVLFSDRENYVFAMSHAPNRHPACFSGRALTGTGSLHVLPPSPVRKIPR